MNNYTVSTGNDYREISIELTGIATSAFSLGDIVTDDKVAITNCMNTQGGSACLKELIITETKTAGSLQKKDLDIIIFNNLATDTLGLNSGDVFVYDGTNNNVSDSVYVKIEDTDWWDLDANNSIVIKQPNLLLRCKDSSQYSLSFCIVARGTPTYDSHTLNVIFKFARD